MRPQVLGQDHGAGPHVHAILRVQHLQDTGRGAVPGSGALPRFPVSRPPLVPRARARPAPPDHPRTGTAARAPAAAPPWANRGRTRVGARPRRPIGASSPTDVTQSAAAGADGDEPLAQPPPPPGAAVKPGRSHPRRCPGGAGRTPPRAASRRREETG